MAPDSIAIDAYVEQQRQHLKLPGVALALVEGTAITHLRGFGRARPGGEIPTPHTPFYIGSLTKSFTALAVMQLAEAGKLELDAPVQCYLPWFRVADAAAGARITVRHLLHQTSGLPEACGEILLADFDARPDATARQARTLAAVALAHPVGTVCEYSNANYNLLGLVLEAVTGDTYAAVLARRILAPLGMSCTFTSPEAARQNGLAVGHQFLFGAPVPAPAMTFPRGSLPAGGILSSAQDLARYLIVHLQGERGTDVPVLSHAGMQTLHRGAVEYRKLGISAGSYAMGWFDSQLGHTRVVWHSGTLPHFGAFMAFLPDRQCGVVLLFNACHHWYNPLLTGLGMGVVARLAGETYAPIPGMGSLPVLLRAQRLVPLFQLVEMAAVLGGSRRGTRSPTGTRAASILTLMPDLLLLLSLVPMLGKQRGYYKYYMPDTYRIARLCGTIALAGLGVRAARSLAARYKPPHTP